MLKNLKNAIVYYVDFVVVDGNATIQEIDLVRVQYHNMSLKVDPTQPS